MKLHYLTTNYYLSGNLFDFIENTFFHKNPASTTFPGYTLKFLNEHGDHQPSYLNGIYISEKNKWVVIRSLRYTLHTLKYEQIINEARTLQYINSIQKKNDIFNGYTVKFPKLICIEDKANELVLLLSIYAY
jgi:hypothetical protein